MIKLIEIRINTLSSVVAVVFINFISFVIGQDIVKIFDNCHTNSIEFETCMKKAFNDLRPLFKSGKYYKIYAMETFLLFYQIFIQNFRCPTI